MKEKINQLSSYPYYVSIDRSLKSLNIQEICKKLKKLTINKNYKLNNKNLSFEELQKIYYLYKEGKYYRETIFNEIISLPFEQNDRIEGILKKKRPEKTISLDKLTDLYLDALKRFISENWEYGKTHIVTHSGGYDSRILSKLLFDFRKNIGKDKFGDIRFITWAPEIDESEVILDYIGWERELFIPIRREFQEVDYFANIFGNPLEMGRILTEGNRTHYRILNMNIVLTLGKKKEDLIFMNTDPANRVIKYNLGYSPILPNIEYLIVQHHFDAPINYTFCDKNIYPFYGQYNLDLMTEYKIPQIDPRKYNHDFSQPHMLFNIHLLRRFDPDLESVILNPTKKIAFERKRYNHIKAEKISEELRNKITKFITSSWYYKNFKYEVDKLLPIPNFISSSFGIYKIFSKICICEYLIQVENCDIQKK